MGELNDDPVKKRSSYGLVVTFFMDTTSRLLDKGGLLGQAKEWHKVSCFWDQGKRALKHLKKGSVVYVDGGLVTRKYLDSSNTYRYATWVQAQRLIFMDDMDSLGNSHLYEYTKADILTRSPEPPEEELW